MELEKVDTKDQLGDLLTKALEKETIQRLSERIGLRSSKKENEVNLMLIGKRMAKAVKKKGVRACWPPKHFS